VAETNVAFITGTTSLDTFDSYLSTLDSMGIKDLLKVKQQQYDRFKATK
jgi:putative aldouronate transport system substrate-binding protein